MPLSSSEKPAENKQKKTSHSRKTCEFYIYIYILMNRLEIIKNQIGGQTEKPFKGKTIVVTGGSRGIGLAIAKACAKDGANVAILAKTIE